MTATKDDAMLLLKLDEVHQPSTEARQFVYSDELAEVVRVGAFFDTYSLDSRERFFINEVATYFEILGTFRSTGIVDADLAVEWAGAKFTWKRIGPILIQAREVFGDDRLWCEFEALAQAQG
jgi:hypothetical protein